MSFLALDGTVESIESLCLNCFDFDRKKQIEAITRKWNQTNISI